MYRGFFFDCIDIISKCIRFVVYIINDISFKEEEFKEFISGELRFDVNKIRIYFRINSLYINIFFLSLFVWDIWLRVLVWEDWWNFFLVLVSKIYWNVYRFWFVVGFDKVRWWLFVYECFYDL